ncbi:MAG: universal stress protein [Sandaracinaceae bacterium]|nr:universal stress protein [Sandaracinaceae bacterium]
MATDLTEASHEAVHFAAMLAGTVPAALELLHVVDMVNVEDLPEHADPAVTDYVDAIRTRLERRLASRGIKLDARAHRCGALGARCKTGIADDRVWEVLLRPSQETGAGFIVVGPHPRGPGRRAERHRRRVPVRLHGRPRGASSRAPVWVVPAKDRSAEAPFRAPNGGPWTSRP